MSTSPATASTLPEDDNTEIIPVTTYNESANARSVPPPLQPPAPALAEDEGSSWDAVRNKNVKRVLFFCFFDGAASSIWRQNCFQFLIEDLGGDRAVGLMSAASGISQMVFALISGILGDRLKRQMVLRLGAAAGLLAVLFTIGNLSWLNLGLFYVGQTMWGAYYGISATSTEAIFADSVPTGRRAFVYNLKWMDQTLSSTVGITLTLILLVQMGNTWHMPALLKTMTAGLLLHPVAMAFLCFMKDKHALPEEEEEGQQGRGQDAPQDESSLRGVEGEKGEDTPRTSRRMPSHGQASMVELGVHYDAVGQEHDKTLETQHRDEDEDEDVDTQKGQEEGREVKKSAFRVPEAIVETPWNCGWRPGGTRHVHFDDEEEYEHEASPRDTKADPSLMFSSSSGSSGNENNNNNNNKDSSASPRRHWWPANSYSPSTSIQLAQMKGGASAASPTSPGTPTPLTPGSRSRAAAEKLVRQEIEQEEEALYEEYCAKWTASQGHLPRQLLVAVRYYTTIMFSWCAVPYYVCLVDFLVAFGSGMTMQYLALFFKKDYLVTPAQLMTATLVISPLQAFFSWCVQHLGDLYVGRLPATIMARLAGTTLMLFMGLTRPPLVIMMPIYVVRNALMNCTRGVTRSVIMDCVPKKSRAKWSAFESFSSFTWAGSAVVGGFIAEAKGYQFSFTITALFHFCALAVLVPGAIGARRVEAVLMAHNRAKAAQKRQ